MDQLDRNTLPPATSYRYRGISISSTVSDVKIRSAERLLQLLAVVQKAFMLFLVSLLGVATSLFETLHQKNKFQCEFERGSEQLGLVA